MKLLFIEDEPIKCGDIKEVLFANVPNIQIYEANSYSSGLNYIRNDCFDYMLLDMSLPLYDYSPNIYDQNEFETFAGLDILDEVCRLKKQLKTIIITAFDVLGDNEAQINLNQLDIKMKNDYPDFYLGVIHYNVSSLEWRNNLINMFLNENNALR